MIIAFVTSNLVTAGMVFIATAIVLYNIGRRDERAAFQHQRASSAAVRGRLALLAVKAAAQPPRALPAARRDHAQTTAMRLRPIGKARNGGNSWNGPSQ
jgi:hypothetical protein